MSYDADKHRHDCALGDVPMLRPLRQYNEAHVLSYLYGMPVLVDGRVPRGAIEMRCFAPCTDQLQGRMCPCTWRQLSPEEPKTCPECGHDLHGYRGPLCRYCDPEAYCE